MHDHAPRFGLRPGHHRSRDGKGGDEMKGFHYEGIVPQQVTSAPSASIASKLTTDNWEECATLRAKQASISVSVAGSGRKMIRYVIASTPAPIMTFRRTLPGLEKHEQAFDSEVLLDGHRVLACTFLLWIIVSGSGLSSPSVRDTR